MTPALQDAGRWFVVQWDRFRGVEHERCPGCGCMDAELDTEPCVLATTGHHPIPVDRYGNLLR